MDYISKIAYVVVIVQTVRAAFSGVSHRFRQLLQDELSGIATTVLKRAMVKPTSNGWLRVMD